MSHLPTWTAERIVEDAGTLGEGPRWDWRSQRLHWVDIPDGAVHRLEPDGSVRTVRLDRPVGCIQPARSGGWVLAMETGVAIADAEFGSLRLVGEHPERPVEVRFNDGGCDPRGRLFAGTMAYDESPGAGALYRFDAGGPVSVQTHVTISNGIGWSGDGSRLYYVDSPTRRLTAFEYDVTSGALGAETTVRSFDDLPDDVVPDGLCVDAEDHVWVAFWNGARVLRIAPDGTSAGVVEVPTARPTCPAFGGAELDTLYVTSAGGGLFSARPGVTGRPLDLVDDSIWLASFS